MTDTKETKQTSTGKLPSHVAYHVRDREGASFWTRIGSVWAHRRQRLQRPV